MKLPYGLKSLYFRPLAFDNRRSEREQSQVYLNYAKPQGGKQS